MVSALEREANETKELMPISNADRNYDIQRPVKDISPGTDRQSNDLTMFTEWNLR